MAVEIEVDDYNKASIDTFTTEKGYEYVGLRMMNKNKKSGTWYPSKTLKGSFLNIFMSAAAWMEVLPRMMQFVSSITGQPLTNSDLTGGLEIYCSKCDQRVTGGKVFCESCLKEMEGPDPGAISPGPLDNDDF